MTVRILVGDCLKVLKTLPGESVNCCVTSPPYWGLRDYGVAGQLGLEPTPQEYVEKLVAVFREVRRVLRDDGTLWLNLGDSYATGQKGGGGKASSTLTGGKRDSSGVIIGKTMPTMTPVRLNHGLKPKDLVGIPWRVAFALQADGWYLRQDIIWAKPNPMPESVRDRCTKSHEYLFLLAKSEKYYCDMDAIAEPFADERNGNPGTYNWKQGAGDVAGGGPNSLHKGDGKVEGWNIDGTKTGRNKRSVWTVATQPFKEAHFATFPPKLIEPCILAGCPVGGTVLDPFGGSGRTGQVAEALGRKWLLIELNSDYAGLAADRTRQTGMELACGS